MKSPITVSYKNGNTLFYVEQLSPNASLDSFSCKIIEYNKYLHEDALRSQNDHIALTWLLRERTTDTIVAYMSLIADAIKLSFTEKEMHDLNYPFKTIPAMKIAKLAVSHLVNEQQENKNNQHEKRHFLLNIFVPRRLQPPAALPLPVFCR